MNIYQNIIAYLVEASVAAFDYDENLHTYVKLKLEWGNRQGLFSIFFIENDLFTEIVKKGVRGNEPNDRTVQPTQWILISIEAEYCALQNYREFLFSNFILVFEFYIFFSEKYIFA